MLVLLDAQKISASISMEDLVNRLEEAFGSDWVVPQRQIVEVPGGEGRLFISMPAFDMQGAAAIKLATFFPDNAEKGLPAIQPLIVLFDATGTPTALLDGKIVTQLRTGAASALASRYLSRPDSEHLVLLGTGALAPYMALAHCAVRPIKRVSVWGRRAEAAASTVATIRALVNSIESLDVVESLETVVQTADIVCCATASSTPILEGRWLKPGAFVDLVGSFSPAHRESDDAVVLLSRIYVDTRAGAFAEAGDILDPLKRGVISNEKIEGDLSDLVLGRVKGRCSEQEITLFKSVGTAIEDFATAHLITAGAVDRDPRNNHAR